MASHRLLRTVYVNFFTMSTKIVIFFTDTMPRRVGRLLLALSPMRPRSHFVIRTSTFFRHSDFGFRHRPVTGFDFWLRRLLPMITIEDAYASPPFRRQLQSHPH